MKAKYAYAFSLAALAGCAKQETNINALTAAQAGTDKPIVAVCEEFSDASANVTTMEAGSVMFLGRTVRGTTGGEPWDGSDRSCTVASKKEMLVSCSVGAADSYKHIATFKTSEFTMSAGHQGGERETTLENMSDPSLSYKTAAGETVKVNALWHTSEGGKGKPVLVPGLNKFAECNFR
jgi:hypothetical protein